MALQVALELMRQYPERFGGTATWVYLIPCTLLAMNHYKSLGDAVDRYP